MSPPWVAFPGHDPVWGGWRQGVAEHWLLTRFLPFWQGSTEAARAAWLRRYPPPTAEWRAQLAAWAGAGPADA